MIRFAQQDFARLKNYLETYSLQDLNGSNDGLDVVKRLHRQVLAAVQVLAALQALSKANNLTLRAYAVNGKSEDFFRITEFFSDILTASFAAFHGLYKPALMSVRSGVENLVRGCAGLTCKEARESTSVYRLFELAADEPIFQDVAATSFNTLHTEYKDLCKFAHSATPAHTTQSYAVSNFPIQNLQKFRGVAKKIERVVPAALGALIAANSRLYLDVPIKARDLLDDILPSGIKLQALGDR